MKTLITKTICIIICLSFTGTAVPVTTASSPCTKTLVSCLAPKPRSAKQIKAEVFVHNMLINIAASQVDDNSLKKNPWFKNVIALMALNLGTFISGAVYFLFVPHIAVFILSMVFFAGFIAAMAVMVIRDKRAKRPKAKKQPPTTTMADPAAKLRFDARMNEGLIRRLIDSVMQASPDDTDHSELDIMLTEASPFIDEFIQEHMAGLNSEAFVMPEQIRFYNRIILLDLWNKFPEMFGGRLFARGRRAHSRSLAGVMRDWDTSLKQNRSLCINQLNTGPFMIGATLAIAGQVFDCRTRGIDLRDKKAKEWMSDFYSNLVLINYMHRLGLKMPENRDPMYSAAFTRILDRFARFGHSPKSVQYNMDTLNSKNYTGEMFNPNVDYMNRDAFMQYFIQRFFPETRHIDPGVATVLTNCINGRATWVEVRAAAQDIEDFIRKSADDRPVKTTDYNSIRLFDLLALLDLWNKFPEMFGRDFDLFMQMLQDREMFIRISRDPYAVVARVGEYNTEDTAARLKDTYNNRPLFLKAVYETANVLLRQRCRAEKNSNKITEEYTSHFYAALAKESYAESYGWEKPFAERMREKDEAREDFLLFPEEVGTFMAGLLRKQGISMQQAFFYANDDTSIRFITALLKSGPAARAVILNTSKARRDIAILSAA